MRIFILIYLLLLPLQVQASKNQAAQGCEEFHESLEKKISSLNRFLISTEALLSSGPNAEIPLPDIFKVDLTNEKEIASRIEELSQLLSKAEVLAQEEYKKLESCFKDSKDESFEGIISKEVSLNQRKLEFLKLPPEKREALMASYAETQKNFSNSKNLESQLSKSQASIDEARTSLTRAETDGFAGEENNDSLTTGLKRLDQFIIDIESEHIEFIEFFKRERQDIEKLREKLRDVRFSEAQDANAPQISNTFDAVDSVWNLTAEKLLFLFSSKEIDSRFEPPRKVRPPTLLDQEAKKILKDYETLFAKAGLRYAELQALRENLLTELKAQSFRLLNESGHLRAVLIKDCNRLGTCEGVRGLNERYLRSFAREIQILPLKFLAGGLNKMVEFKGKLNAGFDSWVDLARQISVLLFLFLLPFLTLRFFSGLSTRLSSVKSRILARSDMDFRKRNLTAIWIGRLNPFVPSVGMIASIHLARVLLETTDLRELSYLLFYLEVYFVYRASKILIRLGLEYFFSNESMGQGKEKSERAEATAKRLARLIFIQFAILHLIQDTVRKALVYHAVSNLVLILSFLIFVLEIRNWRQEIIQAFVQRFPKYGDRLTRYTEKPLGSLLLPILLLASLAHGMTIIITNQLIRFDFFKRILSDLFRRKIERSEKEDLKKVSADQNYLSQFDYYLLSDEKTFVDRDPTIASGILEAINEWDRGQTSDDLVIIIGNRGQGKTTTLKTIMGRVTHVEKSYHRIPPRILSEKDFFGWLSSILKTEIHSLEDFLIADSQIKEKRILFIDDVHNLFIAQIGGFEAYEAFMEILSLRTRNTFWCLAITSHAWTYLQGVHGRDHFYGKVFKLRMWSDSEIQKLILNRHESTGYSRTFDESVTAYGTGNVLGEKMETQFFRLLWGQSRGNPRAALMHWVSAISQPSEKSIHVGVPQFIESSTVGTMSTEALILLAAISRHDSLTQTELIETTGLDKLIVRKCLKEAHEKELVWSDTESRIRISSRAQSAIDYYLVGKNFLYE